MMMTAGFGGGAGGGGGGGGGGGTVTSPIGVSYGQGQGYTSKMNVREVVNEINEHIRTQAAKRRGKAKSSNNATALEPLILGSINSDFQYRTLLLFDDSDSTAFDTGLGSPNEQYIRNLYWGTLERFFNRKATKPELDKAVLICLEQDHGNNNNKCMHITSLSDAFFFFFKFTYTTN